jgi:hypothetical protein
MHEQWRLHFQVLHEVWYGILEISKQEFQMHFVIIIIIIIRPSTVSWRATGHHPIAIIILYLYK